MKVFFGILWKCVKIPFRIILGVLDFCFLIVRWVLIIMFFFMFFMTQG